MKILFQGDSITDAGRRKETNCLGTGYPVMISGELGAHYPGKYSFVNKGISGNRIVDIYARIKVDGWNLEPDVFSLLIGVNDVWHEFGNQNGVEPERFEKVYRMLIEDTKAKLPGVKFILMEPFVLPGEATVNTEEHPARWEYFRKETDLRAAAAKRIAQKHNLTFVPLQEMFDKANADAPAMGYWLRDGVHPTFAGHALIKNAWLKAFEQMK